MRFSFSCFSSGEDHGTATQGGLETRPVTRRGAPLEKFSPSPGKMCWTYFKAIGHSFTKFSPSQKTLRPPWCPKLVTGLLEIPHSFQQVQKFCWLHTKTGPNSNGDVQYKALLQFSKQQKNKHALLYYGSRLLLLT